MLSCLNGIVVNGRRLKANVARFSRVNRTSTAGFHKGGLEEMQNKSNASIKGKPVSSKSMEFLRKGVSFKDIITGSGPCKSSFDTAKVTSVVIPSVVNISSFDWIENCLIGELKDVDMLSKCFSVFNSTGIGNCWVKYLGGLNVLLRFENSRVADAFLSEHKESWSYWFAWLSKWNSCTRNSFRAVWIKVYGVPIQLRDLIVFQIIAEKWGRILVPVEVNPDANNFSFGRLCILTARKEILNISNIEVSWRDTSFKVCIQEDGDWCPPFSNWKQYSEEEQSDSEDAISDTFENNNQNDEELFDNSTDEEGDDEHRSQIKDQASIAVQNDGDDAHGDEASIAVQNDGDDAHGNEASIDGDDAHGDDVRNTDRQGDNDGNFSIFENNDNNDSSKKEEEIKVHGENNVTQSDNGWAFSGQLNNEGGYEGPSNCEPCFMMGRTLPDLNVDIPCSGSTQNSCGNSRRSKMEPFRSRNMTSLKLKDIIMNSSKNKKKERSNLHLKGKMISDNQNERTTSTSTSGASAAGFSSIEVIKTMEVGHAIGYQFDGAEELIKNCVQGEGAFNHPR
ncbi:hypothetical protein L2E82_35396 [Cichorium intybus]|uniref:Uncharacterized protein n=1 Tax=Cichorium intybus TaxID=13427 RepID=A0ACB9BNQ5_CICIN|nr:hypothetical protein L2E82_35396 [Cichorium intybus]